MTNIFIPSARYAEIKVTFRGHEFVWKYDEKVLGNVKLDGEICLECISADEFITMNESDFEYVLNNN